MNHKATPSSHEHRIPDCVTEVRMGNSILVVSGFYKENGSVTATERMMRVIRNEGATSLLLP